jgi:hypothetical protein
MCTVVIRRQPDQDWPLILAANRDEMIDRAWAPPARHWPDRPEVVAGLDQQAGGSWMGVNDHGVVATILNRAGSLGGFTGKRSRGELVLEALDHADAVTAAESLAALDPDAYRPFNLIIADNSEAFWLAHRGTGPIRVMTIPEGVSMITEGDLNDPNSSRVRRYLPRFRASAPNEPPALSWRALLEDRISDPTPGDTSAMCFRRDDGFGTLCHSMIALPSLGSPLPPAWGFAATTGQLPIWVDIETR